MRINERNVVVAAAAGATAYLGPRFLGRVPAIGGVNPAIVSLAAGAFLAIAWAKEGTVGAAIEGVGYGLIASGAIALAAR